MKKTIEDIKDVVLNMPAKEKNKLLLQLLRKSPETIQKIYYQKVSEEDEVKTLIENLKEEITDLLSWEYSKGGNEYKNMAKGIAKASKEIGRYKSVLNPEQETEINMHLLDIIFTDLSVNLGTCWTVFDHKVTQTLSKTINLVTKKIHEDYRVEFEGQLNTYLKRLKAASSHLDYVYILPDRIEY